jgi:hypothetical protein
MQKMYAQASDLSAVLRKAVQLRLAAPPVVAGPPILYECLKLGQRDPLRPARDGLAVGKTCLLQSKFQIVECAL